MKAVNDYRILMPNVPYYETGILFNQYEIVYYTGINAGTYTDATKNPPLTQTVENPVSGRTGYYYLKKQIYNISGDNKFWTRPDSELNDVDATQNFYDWWVQNFFFIPTYGSSVEFTANYYENSFQDNYRYILGKSENIIQVKATLNFEGITDNEARAINHFYQNYFNQQSLSYGQGQDPVEMNLFYPHEKTRPFYLTNIDNNFDNVDFNRVVVEVESPFISLTSWKEKLIPFKTENNYFDTVTYTQHDIVYARKPNNSSKGFYYYSGTGLSINIDPYNAGSGNNWTQKFYFSPDLVQNLTFKSSDYKNDLGNFYLYQQVGINPNLLDFEISFNNRSDKEAKAILHFFENHNGLDLFQYDMFPPYTGTRAFYCPQWSHTYNFYDNHTIKAKFIESKFDYSRDSVFDTSLNPSGINFGFVPLGFLKNQEVKIKNNENRPITFTISSDVFEPNNVNNKNVDFVSQSENENQIQVAKAGGYATYNINCNLNYVENEGKYSPPTFYYTGAYYFTQENENLGLLADNDLKLSYSGLFHDVGETISEKFLSGLKTCIAAPYYDFNLRKICLKTQFIIPESGYYFNNFSGRLTNTSGAFIANQFTGSSVGVNLNNTTSLYDIGDPGLSSFSFNFTGISLGVDYYIRVSGLNTNYLGENAGDYVFATGVNRITDPISNLQVISGLTINNLSSFGINPPSIRIDKSLEEFIIDSEKANYFDLYKYIENNARFGNAFELYSGVRINFKTCEYGPLSSSVIEDVFNTGVFIITGDYSPMPLGVTLNFENSKIIGKGGNVYRTKNVNNPVYEGKNAFYIKCSGVLNINKDFDSVFAGGGAAGDNINFEDVVNKVDTKFATFKSPSNTPINKKATDIIKNFNNSNVIANNDYVTTKGSSILYYFYDPRNTSDPYLVFGGAGAGYGKGTGIAGNIFIQDANKLNASDNYILNCVIEMKKPSYITQGDN